MTSSTLTSQERFRRMFEHREADRIPVVDYPWGATIERWQREGMPAEVSYVDFFGLDRVAHIGVNNGPRWQTETIAETEEYTIVKTDWGATLRNWKHVASTPEFLDFTVKDRDSWATAKARMTMAHDRVDWAYLKKAYPTWRRDGCWIQAGGWFGFDITHSWFVGTETVLMAMIEDPEWLVEMWQTELELNLALLDLVWDAGYTFDSLNWPDDMGYKLNQFFSLATYRALLKPIHQRAIAWAHAKGVKAHLHSCGDIRPFVPELVEIGLDALNPLEVKAGMDPLLLKAQFGAQLALHGGINAVLWDDISAIETEMRLVVPTLKTGGGYIFSSDHSVPSSVSLDNFRYIVNLAKDLGRYT